MAVLDLLGGDPAIRLPEMARQMKNERGFDVSLADVGDVLNETVAYYGALEPAEALRTARRYGDLPIPYLTNRMLPVDGHLMPWYERMVFTRVPGLAEPLSDAQVEVVQRMADGLETQAIADDLNISLTALRGGQRRMYRALFVNNDVAAVTAAILNGMELAAGPTVETEIDRLDLQIMALRAIGYRWRQIKDLHGGSAHVAGERARAAQDILEAPSTEAANTLLFSIGPFVVGRQMNGHS